MEINRKLLKQNARNAMKGIYWFMFVVCIVAGIVGVGNSASSSFSYGIGLNFPLSGYQSDVAQPNDRRAPSSAPNERYDDERRDRDDVDIEDVFENALEGFSARIARVFASFGFKSADTVRLLTVAAAAFLLMLFIAMLVFAVFISGPAEVSFARVKLAAVIEGRKDSGEALFPFKYGYIKTVKNVFLKNLYIALWRLLPIGGGILSVALVYSAKSRQERMLIGIIMLIADAALFVPSIVKSYQYMLVPYILAETPDISSREAIRLSRGMMNGFKWQTFVLQLSFIGWYFVSALLCGIGVLFVHPYYHTAETLLYDELRNHYNGANIQENVQKIEAQA